MLEAIKSKMQEEQFQRAMLNAAALVTTYVVSRAVANVTAKTLETGINALMTKLHPTVEETPATE